MISKYGGARAPSAGDQRLIFSWYLATIAILLKQGRIINVRKGESYLRICLGLLGPQGSPKLQSSPLISCPGASQRAAPLNSHKPHDRGNFRQACTTAQGSGRYLLGVLWGRPCQSRHRRCSHLWEVPSDVSSCPARAHPAQSHHRCCSRLQGLPIDQVVRPAQGRPARCCCTMRSSSHCLHFLKHCKMALVSNGNCCFSMRS